VAKPDSSLELADPDINVSLFFMPLARKAIYLPDTQILIAPTWDKSPNWLQTMQHVAWEGGLFVLSICQAIPTDDIPDRFEFKKRYPGD
jgi:nitrilase